MPAIDFPAAPAVNDEYSFEGRTWRWNGTGWEVKEYPAALLAGSAANPSLYFSGDPNTGLYSPGADQVAISTGGTGRLFVDASGRVGVGTDTPEQLVQLSSVTPILSLRESDQTTDEKTFDFRVNSKEFSVRTVNDGYTAARQAIAITRSTGIDIDHIRFSTGAGTERLRIDSSGRLLVGTSTTSAAATVFMQGSSANSAGNPVLFFARGSSNPADGQGLGQLAFSDSNHTASVTITVQRDGGTWTSGSSQPSRLVFSTTADGAASPTERMVIKADGNVGIGTSGPSSKLHVIGGTTSGGVNTAAIFTGGTVSTAGSGARIYLSGSPGSETNRAAYIEGVVESGSNDHSLRFATSAASASPVERVRIDSSGRLLVGTSADITGAAVQIAATTGDASSVSAARFGANATPGYLSVFRSRGATVGTHAALTADDGVGALYFFGSDGAAYRQAAAITAFVDGGVASADMPGRLVFSTTADGASSPTEAMRINNQRELLIGTTTRTANGGVLQISNGITFPGTQSACSDANTLDDYEEGTWTPQLELGAATTGITYNARQGYYVKIGKVVFITVYFNLSSKGTATGNATVTGLPFSAEDFSISGTTSWPGGTPTRRQNHTATNFAMSVTDNTATVAITDGAGVNLTDTTFTNGTIIECAFNYRAA